MRKDTLTGGIDLFTGIALDGSAVQQSNVVNQLVIDVIQCILVAVERNTDTRDGKEPKISGPSSVWVLHRRNWNLLRINRDCKCPANGLKTKIINCVIYHWAGG